MLGRCAAAGLWACMALAGGAVVAWAGDPADTRAARGINLTDQVQEISPQEQVALFSGHPSYHQVLLRWPEPGDQELVLSVDYSGSVEHHRFDFAPSSGFTDASAAFGEWSLNLNGHTLWTGNLAPYLWNGEVPGQPHRDASGLVIDHCWRTCGYSICDHAYASGGSNGDVDLAVSGSVAEFGYVNNNPLAGNPVMLPNDPASAWRASLPSPANTGRVLTLKKPDGTTWRFNEVALTMAWPNYYFNNNQGPRAFRLASISGATSEFQASLTYEYNDSGPQKNAFLHPTAVHLLDQVGRNLDITFDEDLAYNRCQIDVHASSSFADQVLDFTERTYLDRQQHSRHSYLFYLSTLRDRVGRLTGFRYEPDNRAEAYYISCAESLDIRAQRLIGVDYSTGGRSTYTYLPLPATRPHCPDAAMRYEDSAWQSMGRSTSLSPIVGRVEIQEDAHQAPVQTLGFVYAWDATPPPGSPMESVNYRYSTRVDFNLDSPAPPKPGPGPRSAASGGGYSVNHEFLKFPYRPRTYGAPVPTRWDAKLLEATVSLSSGESHTATLAYDAVDAGGYFIGTLQPAQRFYQVRDGSGVVGQFSTSAQYDTLARIISSTDAAGTRVVTSYFDDPALHSPWSGTGRYMVLLPARETALDSMGVLLAETWYDREAAYGRVTSSHTRIDAARVATRSYAYDSAFPSRVVQARGPMGEVVDFSYATELIPGTIWYADTPDRVRPSRTVFHSDASHTLSVYHSYDLEGRQLREADQTGRTSYFSFDGEGRVHTIGQAGDVATGPIPPPPPGPNEPQAPPYDETAWPSTVFNYTDAARQARVSSYPAMLDSFIATTTLDGLGRTRTRSMSTPAGVAVQAFDYDSFGRIRQATGADGASASFAYDELGRPTSSFDPTGAVTTFEYRTVNQLASYGINPPAGMPPGYCGLEITRNPGGRATVRAMDARGILVASAQYASGASLSQPLSVTYFEADGLGRLVSLGPAGEMLHFNYDLAGRRLQTLRSGSALATAVYDLGGRAAFVQDENAAANQTWTYFRLDALGRPVEEGVLTGGYSAAALQPFADAGTLPAGASWHAHYTHDSGTSYYAPGGLSRVEVRRTDGSVDAFDYLYDARKRVVQKTITFAGLPQPVIVRYEYDRLDRPTSVTYPDGQRVNYKYDSGHGRLARIDQQSPARTLLTVARDIVGRPTLAQDGTISIQWRYGPLGLLDSQTGAAAGRTLFSESFTYDSDGRRSSRTGNYGIRWDYTRDAAARLTGVRIFGEPGAPTVNYGYGPAGDLTTIATDLATDSLAVAAHRVVSVRRPPYGLETLTTDPRGDLATRIRRMGSDTTSQLQFVFSPRHELLSVLEPGAAGTVDSAVYEYDAVGWRIRRRAGGQLVYEVRDERGELLAELDFRGSTLRDYVRAEGRVVGVLDGSGAYVAYLTDVLGSVRLGVDAQGSVRFAQEYLPYGELSRAEGVERPALGFLGAQQDPETGYCYLKNRYYDPQQARFVSPDPLRSVGAPEFGYGFDDPLSFTDPEGLLGSDENQRDPLPRYTLETIFVYARRPSTFLQMARALHAIYGNRLDRELAAGYYWVKLYLRVRTAHENIELQHTLQRAAGDVVRALGDPVGSRLRLWSTVVAPSSTYTIDRWMIVHELVMGTRASIALDNLKGMTPAELESRRLKVGVVVLSEATLDLATLGAAESNPVGRFGAVAGVAVWARARSEISDMSEQIVSRLVPGYANTSILDHIFGVEETNVPEP